MRISIWPIPLADSALAILLNLEKIGLSLEESARDQFLLEGG